MKTGASLSKQPHNEKHNKTPERHHDDETHKQSDKPGRLNPDHDGKIRNVRESVNFIR
jgi:hypothetical protein